MISYIKSINRENPVGKMIGEYGDDEWKKGFNVGCIYGISVSTICFVIVLSLSSSSRNK